MKQLMEQYRNGKIGKKEFSDRMLEFHKVLLSYAELIDGAENLKSINILNRGGVNLEIVDKLVEPKSVRVLLTSMDDSRCASAALINFGSYETEELDMFRKITDILNPNSFFDIGANEGWYSFHMMCRYPDLQCYSFEPVRETWERARKNLMINGQPTDNLMNIGLSDRDETAVFYYNRTESGATSLKNIREVEGIERVECQLRRLDDIVREHDIRSMDFVKCDVEGNELFALRGGLESIRAFKPVIFCEMLRKWCAKFGYHPNDIIQMLGEIGYQCYRMADGWLRRIGEITDETVETNFFYLHPEKHEEVLRRLVKQGGNDV